MHVSVVTNLSTNIDRSNLNKIQYEDGATDLQGKAMIGLGYNKNFFLESYATTSCAFAYRRTFTK